MMKQSIILISFLALSSAVNAQNQTNMTINQDAPVVQSKEVLINAAPGEVWNVLTDIEEWSNWNTRIKKTTLREKLKTGARFTWKTNGNQIKSQIHTYDHNTTLGWTGKTFGAKAIHKWTLIPINRGTKVIVEESMEGWIISLMKKKMNTILENDIAYWLDQLKIECEK
jgi:uncharacterized protein YndB with AHSA1/START domain